MTIIFPLLVGEALTWKRILIGIPIWTLGGLGFGFYSKYLLGRKGKRTASS
jgi:hypothetical protein